MVYTILTFLYVFNFKVIKNTFLTSSILVFLILFVYALLDSQYSRMMFKSLCSKYNKAICLYWGLCFIYALVTPVVQLTFDFSFVSAMIHQLICLEIGFMLYALLVYKRQTVLDILLDSFILQSLIQLAAFLNPTFLRLTDYFRADSSIQKRDISYGGYRALAISGSSFFGLAAAYLIIFVLLAFYWDKWKYKSLYVKCMLIILLFFGALSAGRTSVVGIIVLGVSILIRVFRKKEITIKRLLGIGILILGVIGLGETINVALADNHAWRGFLSYLLQFYRNIQKGKNMINATSSTATLFNDMYFQLNIGQILIGDGRYTAQNGLYYMQTDAGYMRNLLYFGIGGTLLLVLFQYKMIFYVVKTKYAKWFSVILLTCLFILEVKAQIVGFLIISQTIILICCLAIEELERIEACNA